MNFRKLLSVALALVLALSMCIPAFADGNKAAIGETEYETLAAALSAAQAGDTVKLLADVNVSSAVMISKSITLDGNGHTLTTTANRGIRIDTGDVDVTVKNLTIVGSAMQRAIQVDGDVDNVTLTIDHVTATVTYYTVNICNYVDNLVLNVIDCDLTGYGVINLWGNNGTVNVSGSTLTGLNDKTYNAEGWNDFATVILEGDTTGATDAHATAYDVTLTNCTIAARSTKGNTQWAVLHNNPSTHNVLRLNGCTIDLGENCEFFLDQATESETYVKGTYLAGTTDVPVLPEGYAYIDAEDDYSLITAAVAQVGSVKYYTLAAAFEAANAMENATVTLLGDYEMETNEPGYGWTTLAHSARENFLEVSGTGLTFDLGGYTLSKVFNNTFKVTGENVTIKNGAMSVATYNNGDSGSYVIMAKGATNLVIDDLTTYGGINVAGGSTATINDLSFSGTLYYAVCSQENSVVTINGGTFNKAIEGSTRKLFWIESGSAMNITGGNFNIEGSAANFLNGSVKPVITGGTFDFDPTTKGVAEGYEVVDNGDGTWTVVSTYAAEVNGVEYATLAAAIEAANALDNATVTLLKDYNMEAKEPGYGWTTSYVAAGETTPRDNMIELSGTGLTLDLGGYTLSNLYNNTFTVIGTDVTIQNGTMEIGTLYAGSYSKGKVTAYAAPRACSYVVFANGAQNFVINDLTTTGGINIAGATTATVNGLNFSGASYYAICSQEDSDVTINGGTFDKATSGFANYLIWVDNESDAVMTITGGTFLKGTATFKTGKNPVIKGGTYDFDPTNFGVAEGYEVVNNGDGTWTVGVVKATGLSFAATEEGYQATFTATKKVLDTKTGEALVTNTPVAISVKTVDEGENVAAATDISNIDLQAVLDSVVAVVEDSADKVGVEIQVVQEEAVTVDEVTVSYEVYPVAKVYVNDALVDTLGIDNSALGGEDFSIKLDVPTAIANAALAGNGKIRVTHKSDDPAFDDEVLVLDIQEDAGAYYVLIPASHFSTFELTVDLASGSLFTGHSISLNGYIDLNFYLNLTDAQIAEGTEVKFTWAKGSASDTVEAGDYVSGKGYKVSVSLPAAEMNYQIHAVALINGVAQEETSDYSVRDYAVAQITANEDAELVTLLKTMLDYGAKAQVVFGRTDVDLANKGIDYEMGSVDAEDIDDAIAAANDDKTADDMHEVAEAIGGDYYSTSLVYLSGSTLRHYFAGYSLAEVTGFTGNQYDYYFYVDAANIAAAELDTLQTFEVGSVTFKYSALDFVKAMINAYSGKTTDAKYDLAVATYWYNQAANAFFA